jgi:hypothetical protein
MKTSPYPSYGYRKPEPPTSRLFGALVVSAVMLTIIIYAAARG